MKKLIALLTAALFIVGSLAACGEDKTAAGNNNILTKEASAVEPTISEATAAGTPAETQGETEEETIDPDRYRTPAGPYDAVESEKSTSLPGLKVEAIPYQEENKYFEVILLITNESDKEASPEVYVTFYDKDGKVVDEDSTFYNALGAGATGYGYLRSDEPFASFEYKLEEGASAYHVSADADVTMTYETDEASVKVSVTNNIDTPVEEVECGILFYEKGVLKFYTEGYCCDDDFEIKPGATQTKRFVYYGEGSFDEARVYYRAVKRAEES